MVSLAACGGGGGDNPQSSASPGTLAYAAHECRDEGGALSGGTALRIRRGEGAPVTVTEFAFGPLPGLGYLCRLVGQLRIGVVPAAGFLQRMGVSPDGSLVVFETTNAYSILPVDPLPPEQEGIFVVRADGTGLRRLSAASREPCHLAVPDLASPGLFRVWLGAYFAFSRNGRTVAYTDRGPGPDGEEATQIVTLDLETGARTQITHLPFTPPPDRPSPREVEPATSPPWWFNDDRAIGFPSYSNPDGLNPDGERAIFFVDRDGKSALQRYDPPSTIAQPGNLVIPQFQITGLDAGVGTLTRPGTPENEYFGFDTVREAFLFNEDDRLQLTNFHRADTQAQAGVFGQRAWLLASADPFGTNPTENCQIFSIGQTGSDLKQLTTFTDGALSANGCAGIGNGPPGCGFSYISQDRSGDLRFASNCNPLGENPYGEQLFAMRSDGTELRQLTDFRGYIEEPDGTATYEWPGGWNYGPWR